MEHDGTFLGEYVHGGKLSEDSFYRVWVRDQEYAEGELMSGLPARDDGYARKAGFRYDKALGPNLDFTFAGSFATRRVDHVMDLSYRLFDANTSLPVTAVGFNSVNSIALTWAPFATGTTLPINTGQHAGQGLRLDRYHNYEEMPQDGSHLRAKLLGITDNDLEWSLSGYAELYDTSLGHVGHSWERKEYDLDFRANKPVGDSHHLSFGAAFRHMSFDVNDMVTSPWAFSTFDLETNSSSSTIPILDYGTSPTSFDRFSGFIQDSIDLSDEVVLSLGSKFEDGDLSGSNFQPGARISYTLNEQNIFWGAYSRAYRQASLVEQYTKVSYARVWDPVSSIWLNQSFTGDPANHDEQMDAYELGWRMRPNADLLIELSLYHYDTKDAVFSGPPIYSLSDVKTTGGELTFDYRPSDTWYLQGGYSYSRGKKDGAVQVDFPESMANLTSHIKIRDNLLFSQNLYFTDDRIIPSAYNEIPIEDYLRLDLGLVWRLKEDWEIGLFGRDLLDSDHPENMYNDLDVEPGKVEQTFLLSITKEF
jgi:hypothetical protein